MNRLILFALALLLLMAIPMSVTAHPDHDISGMPELTDIDHEADWVAGQSQSPPRSKILYPGFYKALFPLVYVSGGPGYAGFGTGGAFKTIYFDEAEEQSLASMFNVLTAGHKLVAPREGLYEFFGDLWISDSAGPMAYDYKIRIVQHNLNGAAPDTEVVVGKDSRNDLTYRQPLRVRGIARLEKGDYIFMQFWHNKGSLVPGASKRLFMQRIGSLALEDEPEE